MLLRHVGARSKQQETFTSGSHLQAYGCRQKEMFWTSLGWVLPRIVLFLSWQCPFFWYLFIPSERAPLFFCTVWLLLLQGCLLLHLTMWIWFWGVLMLMEDAPWLHELQMFWHLAALLIVPDRWWSFCGWRWWEKAWLTVAVTDFKVCVGACGSWPHPRLWWSRQLRVNR